MTIIFTNQQFLAVNVEGDISIVVPYFFKSYAKGSKPNGAHMFIKFQLKLFRKPEVKTSEICSIFFSKSCIRDTER